MGRRFLAAAVQLCAGSDKAANFASAATLGDAARPRRGAELIVLPEMFVWRGKRADEDAAAADRFRDRRAIGSRALAARARVVSGRRLAVRSVRRRARRYYNTSHGVRSATAPCSAATARSHLFDVDIPGHVTRARVGDATCPAPNRRDRADRRSARSGLSICYDLRFPELYRRLGAAGAEIVCCRRRSPSRPARTTGRSCCARARSRTRCTSSRRIRSAAAPSGVADFGHSLIVDPWGTPIARATNSETAIVAEIDLDYLARVRRELPCLEHRKFDV